MQLHQGALLQGGKYRIEHVLGQGGFGITYLATQAGLNRKVAIKEFFMKELCSRDRDTGHVSYTDTHGSAVENFKKKFIKEGRTISSLNHPNIIHIYDNFEENGTAYYAMEYIDGCSMEDMLKQYGTLTENTAIQYIKEVAGALEYIHRQHINHLDIKPANIMVRRDNNSIVLIDFGVAKQYDASTDEGTTSTPVGVSNGYSPLEQYTEGGVNTFSPHSDIYSLGATLYRMVVGHKPPHAVTISQEGFPTLPATLSPTIRQAITQAMKLKRSERPQSAAALLDILNGTAEEGDIKVIDVEPPTKPTTRKAPWIIAIIALLLAAGAATAYWFWSQDQGPETIVDNDDDTEDETAEKDPEPEPDYTVSTKTYTYKHDQGEQHVEYVIECPVTQNPNLERSIMEWINEILGGDYRGDFNDPQALIDFYGRQAETQEEEGFNENIHITMLCQTDKYVTFQYTAEMYYEGAAHGTEHTLGATFRKDDGRKFGWNMFSNPYNLQPAIKQGLKTYFQAYSDSELEDNLLLDTTLDLNALPLPEDDPWLAPQGMVLHYTEYEIACYAAGEPTFTIPFDKIKDSLTASALDLIEE